MMSHRPFGDHGACVHDSDRYPPRHGGGNLKVDLRRIHEKKRRGHVIDEDLNSVQFRPQRKRRRSPLRDGSKRSEGRGQRTGRYRKSGPEARSIDDCDLALSLTCRGKQNHEN